MQLIYNIENEYGIKKDDYSVSIFCNNMIYVDREYDIERFLRKHVTKNIDVICNNYSNEIKLYSTMDTLKLDFLLLEKYSLINDYLHSIMDYDCYVSNMPLTYSRKKLLDSYHTSLINGIATVFGSNARKLYVGFHRDCNQHHKQYIISQFHLYKPYHQINNFMGIYD